MKQRNSFFITLFFYTAMETLKISFDSMKLFLQKQPHNLTIAKHTLGIHQMRIIVRIIEALQPFMSMKVDYTKPSKDIWVKIKVSELVLSNNVKPLRDALDGLMRKIVRILHYIPEKANYLEIGTTIIQEYAYEHGDTMVKIKISSSLLPQIIDLARGYTKYSLQVAFNTSSPKVFKLYQYIAHFRDLKQIQCNIDTLKQWLQLENKYNRPNDIKRNILDPAIKELKEKADVWFEIAERVTEGRKMVGWKFNIYSKPRPKKEIENSTLALKKTNFSKENKEQKNNVLAPQSIYSLADNLAKKKQEFEDLKAKYEQEKYKQGLKDDYGLGIGQVEKLMDWEGDRFALYRTLGEIKDLKNKGLVKNIGAYTVKILREKLGIIL